VLLHHRIQATNFTGEVVDSKSIVVEIDRAFLPQQIATMELVKKKRYVLYSGAVRAGKTLLAVNIAIRTCIDNPGCRGFIGALTMTQLMDVPFTVFLQELEHYQKALDDANIPIKLARVTRSKGDVKAWFYNGSVILFKQCDDEAKIRGDTLDFVILDEPIEIDEAIFQQLILRISGTGKLKNQFILLTTNPGSQSHWIYQRFFNTKDPNYCKIQTTTYDNTMLPRYAEYIEEIKGSGDADWVRRFLDGTWDAFAGQVYKEFNKKVHVGEYKQLKKFDYYVAGVDWGFRNPCCILTLGVKGKDVFVIDEYYQREKPSHKIAEIIAQYNEQYNYAKVYFDPSNPDLIFQSNDLGVPVEKAERDVNGRIGKIKSLLKNAHLHIDSSCVNTIREFNLYRYKKDLTGNNLVEEPAKLDDHSLDALGYALTNYRAFRAESVVGWLGKALWDF
jgi:PBSX family phage terminase large subunit